jgi:hypothetical protein
MAPCVEWVFVPPTQLGVEVMVWAIRGGNIGGAVCTEDGKLVLLTNYGMYWGFIEDSHAYLLDVETGLVIRRVTGPYATIGDWHMDGKTIYLAAHRQDHYDDPWWALDLHDGSVRKWLRKPAGRLLKEFGPNPPLKDAGSPRTEVAESNTTGKYYFDVGGGRRLITPYGFKSVLDLLPALILGRPLDLEITDSAGGKQVRCIGLVPLFSECHVLINDSRRLLFCTYDRVICVDMRSFPPPTPTTGPAMGTQPAEPSSRETKGGEAREAP